MRVDDQPWQEARLAGEPTPDGWRQFVYEWPAQPGRHSSPCGPRPATARSQTGEQADPVPDGATGWHSILVEVTG